jgi:hypothetical protein
MLVTLAASHVGYIYIQRCCYKLIHITNDLLDQNKPNNGHQNAYFKKGRTCNVAEKNNFGNHLGSHYGNIGGHVGCMYVQTCFYELVNVTIGVLDPNKGGKRHQNSLS